MSLTRTSWVKVNRLWTDVGRFHSSMNKWGLAPSPNCECGAVEQTADHVLIALRNCFGLVLLEINSIDRIIDRIR